MPITVGDLVKMSDEELFHMLVDMAKQSGNEDMSLKEKEGEYIFRDENQTIIFGGYNGK